LCALSPTVATPLEIVTFMSKHVTAPALAVDVRELLQKPGAHQHVVLRASLDDLATPVASVPPDRTVTVDAEIESVVEGLLVTGRVTATAVVRCVRCLRDLDLDLKVEVRELFARQLRDDEDEGYAVLPDDRLPLDTMARDAVVLGFPAFPRCRPDCAGLCPVCGADRNSADCGHGGPENIDPRWAGLADLRASIEPAGFGEPRRGAPINEPAGFGEPRRGAPINEPEGFGEPRRGAPINEEEDDASPQA
jgi:uncharacterized protein